MLPSAKSWLVVPALAAVCAYAAPALGAASHAHAAKRHKVNLHQQGKPPQGTKLSGTMTGKPFGKCRYTGKLLIPKAVLVLHCKGGNVNFTATANGAANEQKGTWVIRGGSRKYKHARGTGKLTGILSKAQWHNTGSVSY